MTQEFMNFGTIQEEPSQFSKDKEMVVENKLFIYLFLSFKTAKCFKVMNLGAYLKENTEILEFLFIFIFVLFY